MHFVELSFKVLISSCNYPFVQDISQEATKQMNKYLFLSSAASGATAVADNGNSIPIAHFFCSYLKLNSLAVCRYIK